GEELAHRDALLPPVGGVHVHAVPAAVQDRGAQLDQLIQRGVHGLAGVALQAEDGGEAELVGAAQVAAGHGVPSRVGWRRGGVTWCVGTRAGSVTARLPLRSTRRRCVMTESTLEAVLTELASLEDPKVRAVNERHGDDHGVNLTRLRDVARRLKTQQDLAVQLWQTGDGAARLLALLICRPKAFSAADLDRMLRDARTPKVRG